MEIELSAGRRAHYASFYDSRPPADLAIVLGNCQAESLRIAMTGSDLTTIRIPPVHELTASDLPYLDRALERARVIVMQPIRDGYRGLAIGTRQLAGRLGLSTSMIVVPAVRHRALHPMQAVVRIPDVAVTDPPLVAYHDLRIIADALGAPLQPLTTDRVRRIASDSTISLRTREQRAGAVPISDVFANPSADLLRTMNHPGNPVFVELARRVRERLGLTAELLPLGRPLLSSIVAPLEPVVVETWQLGTPPDPYWTVEGERIHADVVAEAHRRWYRDHPHSLAIAADRHAAELQLLQDA